MQPTSPPGWYADPQDAARQLRWFDGHQWTGHVAPRPGAAPPAGQHPDSVAHWLLPLGRSWQSIAAGYVGLVSIFLLVTGPIAIGLGIWGLQAAKKEGTHGRGRSIFGIIGGTFGTLALIAIFAFSS